MPTTPKLRKELDEINGKRLRFRAVVDCFSDKRGFTQRVPTICLKTLRRTDTGQLVMQACEFTKGKAWGGIAIGNTVDFEAMIEISEDDRGVHYCLRRPTKVTTHLDPKKLPVCNSAMPQASAASEERDAILVTIIEETRNNGKNATACAAHIGELCMQYCNNYRTRDIDRITISKKLKEEGLDSNVTRSIQMFALTQLVPEALDLSVRVCAKLLPMVYWCYFENKGASYKKTEYAPHVPKLVKKALKERWTAEQMAVAAAKVRPPQERSNRTATSEVVVEEQVVATGHRVDGSGVATTEQNLSTLIDRHAAFTLDNPGKPTKFVFYLDSLLKLFADLGVKVAEVVEAHVA